MSLQYRVLCLKAILYKEFIEMRHDYLVYVFIIIVPFLQALLFGFIINFNPKFLPTIVVSNDQTSFTQNILRGLENTHYFRLLGRVSNEAEAIKLMQMGKAQFIVNIPVNFTRDLIRGRHPHLLIEADGSDPLNLGNAVQAANKLVPTILNRNLQGSLDYLLPGEASFKIDVHNKYNPSLLAEYHTMPGMLSIILISVLVILTAASLAGEYEQGTYETILTTSAQPFDVILGKLLPPVLVGYCVYILIILITIFVFRVPFHGSFLLLTLIAAAYIFATLGVGTIASAISKTQFEAMNYANLYVLPSLLLSGYIYPFNGMPAYARAVGEILPATHFLRITYNIMLKDTKISYLWPDIWPILLFLFVVITLSMLLYRKTLD